MSYTQLVSDDELRELKRMIEKLKQTTGIDIPNNYFEDEKEAKTFFENLGFSIEQHNSIEVIDDLVSPQKWNLNPEKVEKIMRNMTIFAMETKIQKSW